MIRIGWAYDVAGVMFAAVAIACAADRTAPRRWNAAAFWGLVAASFLLGDRLGDLADGVLVLALVAIGAAGLGPAPALEAEPRPARSGAAVFLPLLIVPATTVIGTIVLGPPLVDPKQATVISLALGAVLALAAAMIATRAPLRATIAETARLMQSVGWAAILPQLLAALGAVFVLARVGPAAGTLIARWLPLSGPLAASAAFCGGMALFTMIVGNAFAAFPVMVAAIGAPVVVGRFGGEAAAMGAIGMLSGYCGTLMSPLASQNIVADALLGLPRGALIRIQAPTAVIVLCANIVLMNLLAFRHHGGP